MLTDTDYAMIGKFMVTIASAETVVGKLWWHLEFSRNGRTLSSAKVQLERITTKLDELRKCVPSDGSRLDKQVTGLELGFDRVSKARNTLAHGYVSENGGFSINLRDDHRVWMSEIPDLMPWAEYIYQLAMQAYTDSTRGIYAAEQEMPPIGPIISAPAEPEAVASDDGGLA